jgi:hypothetical protein
VHLLRRHRWRGALRAERFDALLRGALESMPGLTETDPGRQARRDLVIAACRCQAWGGFEYARRFIQIITDLYHADRGDAGRALTRNAVLPLASVMLIRDPIFIATMATSPEQRRRTRRALNVKRARADELRRRYLTRIELVAFRHRIRVDLRTSDWPARLVAMLRHAWPIRYRGARRQRRLRDYIIDFMERAAREAPTDYDRYQSALAHLHQQTMDNRLRHMALAEARMLAEPDAAEPKAVESS